MIIDYGFSITGKSHVARNICCQDSHRIIQLENGWYVAAIADGVGSAKNSHIGSRIAVDTVVEFCKEFMPWDYNTICIKSMLRTAFNYSYKKILRESATTGEPIESYDTTLTVVIYDGRHVLYAHSGDGAIIGLTTYGDYVEITKPQKGPDGVTVVPLRSGYTKWVIDTYEEDLAAVMLMTDGMLDALCPYLLKDLNRGGTNIYTPLGAYFADPKGFFPSSEDNKKVRESILDFLKAEEAYDSDHYYARLALIYKAHIPDQYDDIISELKMRNYPVILLNNVQDDKTIVGLINMDMPVDEKTPEFYKEPDWAKLQEAWNRKAYPHLYQAESYDVTNDAGLDDAAINTADEATDAEEPIERQNTTGEKGTDMDEVLTVFNHSSPRKQTIDKSIMQDATKQFPAIIEYDLDVLPKRHERPRRKGLFSKLDDILD